MNYIIVCNRHELGVLYKDVNVNRQKVSSVKKKVKLAELISSILVVII